MIAGLIRFRQQRSQNFIEQPIAFCTAPDSVAIGFDQPGIERHLQRSEELPPVLAAARFVQRSIEPLL